LNILIVSPTINGIGGTAQHARDLIKFLKERNHNVDTMSSENTFTIPVKKLKNPSFLISSFLKTKFMKKYDIVHAQHPIAAFAMKGVSAKKVLTIHGVYSKQVGMLHGKSSSQLSSKYEQNAIEWADAVTAGSKEAFDYYSKMNPNVVFIPNAVDIASLPSGTDKRYEKQLVFAGRLSREKGIHTVLDAVKNLPKDVHLVIIGSGPEETTVIEAAKNNKNVHFLGYQPKEKTIPLIRGSTILIQPSLAEGISATLLEAMACKIPVITTDVGGNRQLFVHNKNGILVPPESPEQLLKEITNLLDNNEQRDRITTMAHHEVQKYDWSNVGQMYLVLYEKLLKNV